MLSTRTGHRTEQGRRGVSLPLAKSSSLVLNCVGVVCTCLKAGLKMSCRSSSLQS